MSASSQALNESAANPRAATDAPQSLTAWIQKLRSDKSMGRAYAILSGNFQSMKENEKEIAEELFRVLQSNQATLGKESCDMYAGLDPTHVFACIPFFGLNECGQKDLVHQLLVASSRVAVGLGGAGTGKTHTLVAAAMPFFIQACRDERPARVHFFSETNSSATDVAKKIHAEGLRMYQAGLTARPAVVARVNNPALDKEHAIQPMREEADIARRIDSSDAKSPVAGSKFQGNNEQLPENRTYDNHKVYEALSPSTRLLQFLGFLDIEDEFKFWPQPNYHRGFIQMYLDGLDGPDWDAAVSDRFDDLLDRAYNHMISSLDAIVATNFQAGVSKFINAAHYGVEKHPKCPVIFMDEGAKATEATMIPVIVNMKPEYIVMVGDIKQVSYHISAPSNSVEEQIKLPLLARMETKGAQIVHLTLQQRFSDVICKPINQFSYDGTLRASPDLNSREQVLAFNAAAKRLFRTLPNQYFKADNFMGIDITGGFEQRSSDGKSCFNFGNIRVIYQTLRKMLKDRELMDKVPASQIIIITPYKAQAALHRRMLQRLADDEPEISEKVNQVLSVVVDNCTGVEAEIVIFDVTRTKSLGFLVEDSRVNLACTRARSGLILCGALYRLRGLTRSKGTLLHSLNWYLCRARAQYHVDLAYYPKLDEISPNFSGNRNVSAQDLDGSNP